MDHLRDFKKKHNITIINCQFVQDTDYNYHVFFYASQSFNNVRLQNYYVN